MSHSLRQRPLHEKCDSNAPADKGASDGHLKPPTEKPRRNNVYLADAMSRLNKSGDLRAMFSKERIFSFNNILVSGTVFTLFSFLLSLFIEQTKENNELPMVSLGAMACVLLLAVPPITHYVGGMSMYKHVFSCYQPFKGGKRFVWLQALGWLTYAFAWLLASVFFYHTHIIDIVPSDGIITATGALGFVSQLLIMSSVYFYDPDEAAEDSPAESPAPSPISSSSSDALNLNASASGLDRAHNDVSWNTFAVVCLVLAVFPAVFFMGTDLPHFVPHFYAFNVVTCGLALVALLISAPLTHALAGRRRYKHYHMWQPFQGGTSFVILQSVGWVTYFIALVLALISVYYVYLHGLRPVRGFLAATGVFGLVAQVLLLTSLGFFDGATEDSKADPVHHTKYNDESNDDKDVDFETRQRSPLDGHWGSVGANTLIMTFFAFFIFLGLEGARHSENGWKYAEVFMNWIGVRFEKDKVLPQLGLIAALMLFSAAPVTHTVAGKRKFSSTYSFFQPFTGGKMFVTLQALGWMSYGVALAGFSYIIYMSFVWGYPPVKGLVSSVGALGVVAEICVVISLFYFQVEKSNKARKRRFSLPKNVGLLEAWKNMSIIGKARELALDACSLFLVSWLYNVAIVLLWMLVGIAHLMEGYYFVPFTYMFALITGSDLAFVLVSVMCIALHTPALLVNLVLATLYRLTFIRAPAQTGWMEWQWFKRATWFWDTIARYFSPRVIKHGKLSPDATYVFAWHPHGIIPTVCTWLNRTTEFQKMYPGVDWAPCGASLLFRTPMMREVGLWAGGRDVTRKALRTTLNTGRSILLVPGGQAEMRMHTDDPDSVTIVTRHKGFVRMAVMHGAALVPVISYHENQTLSNIHMPKMQEITCKYLGLGLPHFPYGRWYTSIPNAPAEMVVVFGDSIPVTKNEDPSEEEIDRIHKNYYEQVEILYNRYKAEAGLPNAKVIMA